MPGLARVGVDRFGGSGVRRHKVRLRAFASDLEVQDASALLQAPHLEGRELCTPQRVTYVGAPESQSALDGVAAEVALHSEFGDYYGYTFFIARKR